MRRNKGITLIALIITIIILLILVGVSLNLVIKGDLFGNAEKAVEGTNAKVKEQQSVVDELMKELEDAQKSEQPGSDEEETLIHNWKYTDSSRAKIRCTCVKCKAFNDGDSTGRTLYIGQQIGDTEKITASSILENNVSGWMYKWDVAVRQEISFESQEVKWVVLGFADENKDGFNETILLTTETPSTGKKTNMQTDSFSTSTKKSVTPIRSNINNEITNFKNKKIIQTKYTEGTNKATIGFGSNYIYNNAVNEVERMCKELYGTDVRSITIEDINNVLGYTPTGAMYYDSNSKIQTTGNFTTKLKNLNTWSTLSAQGTNTPDGTNTKDALGNYILDGYWYQVATNSDNIPIVSSTIGDVPKAMIFGRNNIWGYWIANRGVGAKLNYAYFGIGNVSNGTVNSCSDLTSRSSNNENTLIEYSIRPVKSITEEIPEAGDILNFTTTTATTV